MRDNTLHIDGKNYDPESLTCEDLRVHYGTGRGIHVSGSGRNRITKYRVGFQTNIGDIEVSVWMDLMRGLISRLGETEIQDHLRRWAKDNCAWLHTPAQIEAYALELHAARIFENPNWCGFAEFSVRQGNEN